jgi:nucleoid-associated protein YgaU
MKQNDLTDISYSLSPQQYENIFNVYEDSDNGYFYNILRTINFPSDLNPNSYNTYIIEPLDTWPLISWKVYNSVFLWWTICALNNIQNPIDNLIPGQEIKVLKPIYLQNILNSIKLE